MKNIVLKHTPPALKSSLVLYESGFPLLAEIGNGLVFIFAQWSAPCLNSYDVLVGVLSSIGSKCKIHLVNADSIDYAEFQSQFGKLRSSGGYGECFWIKNAKVIEQTPTYAASNDLAAIAKLATEIAY